MFDERDIEMGEAVEAGARDRAIAQAKAALAGPGLDECEDCGREIPAARRAVLPSATRCVGCQTLHEQPGGLRHA